MGHRDRKELLHFFARDIHDDLVHFDTDESRHIIKSMRLRTGDPLTVLDGLGHVYNCILTEERPTVIAQIRETHTHTAPRPRLILAVSPTKNTNRFDFLVEKATELGVYKLIPLITHRSEKRTVKRKRLERIATSAIKQSGNPFLPELFDPMSLSEILSWDDLPASNRWIAHLDRSLPASDIRDISPLQDEMIGLIGPEGGFTQNEIRMSLEVGFQSIALGPYRLRTETAGIYLTMAVARRATIHASVHR